MREGSHNLTLVVMSDPSPSPEEFDEMDEAMSDINSLNPDIVMIAGDLGDVRQGFDYASETLSVLKAVMLPAIGDRDLQVESCSTDEGNIRLFVNAFALKRPYYAHRHAGILFITLSSERHRALRWQPNEVHLSDDQLAWFQETLENNPTTPTIVQCHAPVFGTQIPVVPGVHVRATNPYINHNHHPERLLDIIRQYPQIILWFSGHSQLGQGYANSICDHSGVCFVHVGVHSSKSTRDGVRHSRVVEIQPGHIRIRTFDHAERNIDPQYDYKLEGGLQRLMSSWEVSTQSSFLSQHLSGFHVNENGLNLKPLPTSGYLAYLDSPASPNIHAICPTEQKIYVTTQSGYVWEYDRTSGLPLGTIYLGKRPTCVVATESHVWVGGGDGYIRRVPVDRPERFLRKNSTDVHNGIIPLKKSIVRAMRCIQGHLFVGANRRLYEILPDTDEPIPKAVFSKNVLAIESHQDRLYVLTEDDEISVFTLPDLQPLHTLQIPSHGHAEASRATIDFVYTTDRFCLFASRVRNDIIKASLSDMRVVDQFRIYGKLQSVLFDSHEIYILTEAGRLVCIDIKAMTVKAQRNLEMQAASGMAMDNKFIYVATANPDSMWQEVQVIERRTDMIGKFACSIRTAEKIYPQLEMDMEVTTRHLFQPQLRAKIYGEWVEMRDELLPSQEFEIRLILGRGQATTSPSISRITLKDSV